MGTMEKVRNKRLMDKRVSNNGSDLNNRVPPNLCRSFIVRPVTREIKFRNFMQDAVTFEDEIMKIREVVRIAWDAILKK